MCQLNCQRSLPMLLVYLLSNRIPPVFSGEKHFAQLLYGRPLFVQHLLAEVGLQNLVMGLDCVGQGVRPLYGLHRCSVKTRTPHTYCNRISSIMQEISTFATLIYLIFPYFANAQSSWAKLLRSLIYITYISNQQIDHRLCQYK